MVAITRGPRGALVVTDDGAWEASAPPVAALSTVGAGDTFLAVLVWRLAGGQSIADALRAAVAAGSAALLTDGTGLAQPQDIDRLLPMVTVDRSITGDSTGRSQHVISY
jgi:6-phosphofructokinase 2